MKALLYKVYLHTIPKDVTGYPYDKYYVGITSKNDVRDRWGTDGYGYNGQVFYYAIKKYGWKNIKHDILYENLFHEEALLREKELICKYKSLVIDGHGYNVIKGGSKYDDSRVFQFDSYGNIINIYENINIMYAETGWFVTDIHAACLGNYIQSNGYIWRYEKDIKDISMLQESIKNSRTRCMEPICQYDLESNFIKRWNNSLELYETYKDTRGIRHVCNNVKNVQAFGYLWRYEKDVYIHGVPLYRKYESNSFRIVRFSLDGKFEKLYNSAGEVCNEFGLSDTRSLRSSIKNHTSYRNSFWEYEKNFKNSSKMYFNYCNSNKKFSLGLFRGSKLIKFLGSVRNSSEILQMERWRVELFLDNQMEIYDNTYIRKVDGIEIEYMGENNYE